MDAWRKRTAPCRNQRPGAEAGPRSIERNDTHKAAAKIRRLPFACLPHPLVNPVPSVCFRFRAMKTTAPRHRVSFAPCPSFPWSLIWLGLLFSPVLALAQQELLRESDYAQYGSSMESPSCSYTVTAPGNGTLEISLITSDDVECNPSGQQMVTNGQSVTVGVYAGSGGEGGGSFTLVITYSGSSPLPAITSSLADIARSPNTAVSYTITATNSPYSFSATGLPAGLNCNENTGLISGTVTQSGMSTVTLAATNSVGTGTATLQVYVGTLYNIIVVNGSVSMTPHVSGGQVVVTAVAPAGGGTFSGWDVASGAGTLSDANAQQTIFTLGAADTMLRARYVTAPSSLNYVDRTATTITLIWQPARDTLGIGSYNIYRGTAQVGNTVNTVFTDGGLTPNTSYSYTVKAVNTASPSQLSPASNTLTVSTTQDSTLDSDQDGIPNVLETALGTNASSAATTATPSQTQQIIHRPIP